MVNIDTADYIFLTFATVFTSTIAAIIGQGGGLILFAVLALYMDAPVLIAIHAVIQACSNSSRSIMAVRHIQWAIIRPILIGTVLGAISITPFIQVIHWQWMQIIMGGYILMVTWRGSLSLPFTLPFPLISHGLLQGSLGMALGATGPLSNALLLAKGLSKNAIVASNAVIMSTSHIIKIILFSVLGVAIWQAWFLISLLSIAAIVGSYIGHHIRGRIPEHAFMLAFKFVLSALAVRMIVASLAQ